VNNRIRKNIGLANCMEAFKHVDDDVMQALQTASKAVEMTLIKPMLALLPINIDIYDNLQLINTKTTFNAVFGPAVTEMKRIIDATPAHERHGLRIEDVTTEMELLAAEGVDDQEDAMDIDS
jgi:hypothetical protein